MDIRGPAMRAFKIVDGVVTEEPLEVIDDLDSESLAS